MLFRVEALEKFTVRTVYYLDAASAEEAEQRCKDGLAEYETSSNEEGGEEWIKTVSVVSEEEVDNA